MIRLILQQDAPKKNRGGPMDEPTESGQPPTEVNQTDVDLIEAPIAAGAQRQGRTGWLLFAAACGISTAAAGFGAAHLLAQRYPDLFSVTQNVGVTQRLSDMDQRLIGLNATLAQVTNQSGSADALEELRSNQTAALAVLSEQNAALTKQVRGLSDRLTKLETLSSTATGEVAAQVAAQASLAEDNARAALAAAQNLKAEADAAARHAEVAASVGLLSAALQSGAPFDAALTQLATAGVEIPAPLSSQSQGAPTLTALRAAFPEAARDALAQSLAEVSGTSMWDRSMAFLRSQSGARSLTPRAGDDPDAILSRAEAALATDDLATALHELSALPPLGQARMAEWSGLADRRLQVKTAIAALAAMAAQ